MSLICLETEEILTKNRLWLNRLKNDHFKLETADGDSLFIRLDRTNYQDGYGNNKTRVVISNKKQNEASSIEVYFRYSKYNPTILEPHTSLNKRQIYLLLIFLQIPNLSMQIRNNVIVSQVSGLLNKIRTDWINGKIAADFHPVHNATRAGFDRIYDILFLDPVDFDDYCGYAINIDDGIIVENFRGNIANSMPPDFFINKDTSDVKYMRQFLINFIK